MKYKKKQVLGMITSCDPYTTESIVQIIWYEFKKKVPQKTNLHNIHRIILRTHLKKDE